ncbi:peptidoglycan DD-metalloendopeptidase family protein [Sulfurovum sp. bin170]|uniref:peptidoglycan DD-metalloendopeptidase family protein n=1 Tax=Sulfurovum sp. bin170 TaxID=2695268 RepID=UPI0013E09C81|nr:peptidoglycan DD-metalloendopeptidase family protein [Sulfurovum sp. bin170]NEW61681.1 peptidoglycan DD-metalloendopeptidase family protein [Sulfurovum sp. bin170]
MKRELLVRYIAVVILLTISLFSAKVSNDYWEKGLDFESYLEQYKISKDIIDLLDKDDIQLISEIDPNRRFYEMIASNGVLLQALIPTGEELQLHLFRTPDCYKVEVIPVSYQKDTYVTLLEVENTPHRDIVKKVKNRKLANEFTKVMKHSVNFRGIQKKDKLAIVYDQKMRLGQPIGIPDIKVAMLESHKKRHYVFKHTDGKYYDEDGEELVKKYMGKPLKHIRITSHFTHRRFHPVLKRWKAHLGTDFGAKRGTPILAVAKGKVTFARWKGANGNLVKIRHRDGYATIYAHLSRIKTKSGKTVNKGEVIGYVGSTGRSTGPHLHFGVYLNGRAINPMRMVKFSSKGVSGKEKKAYLRRKKRYTKIIDTIFDENRPSYVWNTVQERLVTPDMREYYKSIGW